MRKFLATRHAVTRYSERVLLRRFPSSHKTRRKIRDQMLADCRDARIMGKREASKALKNGVKPHSTYPVIVWHKRPGAYFVSISKHANEYTVLTVIECSVKQDPVIAAGLPLHWKGSGI